jgi:hypothetical protein
MLLAKMLVAAPWDRLGVWALALLGTTALLGSLLMPLARVGGFYAIVPSSVCSAAVVIGFALSPGSPLAASGAIALMLSSLIWVASLPTWYAILDTRYAMHTRRARCAMLLGAVPGVWLLSQGALELRYGVIVALILPVIALLVTWVALRGEAIDSLAEGGSRVLGLRPIEAPTDISATYSERFPIYSFSGVALLTLAAVYPQALVEFVLRPSVAAMAGGVGALSTLKSDWGLGLQVVSPQGLIQAALPATGVALAVFLSWVALYWLKSLIVRLAPVKSPEPGTEAE